MKKFIVILFFITICSSYGQTRLLDSLKPKTVSINSSNQFKKAVDYFEEVIKYKRNEYNYTRDYLKLADNCLKWSNKHENEEAAIRVKYYFFHYYNNQYKAISETIYRAIELLNFKSFLEMKESVFVLFILKITYNDTKQYDKLLKLLPLYYNQQKKFGSAFSEIDEDKIHSAEQGLINSYAHLYYNLKNYKQAQKYFKLRLDYLKKIELNYSTAYLTSSCQNNIGISFLKEKKNDSALFYFDRALKGIDNHVKGIKNIDTVYLNHFINVINANKADVDIENGQFNKALPHKYKVLKSSKITKEINIQLSTYHDLARIFYFKNKPRTSLKYLDSIFNLIQVHKDNQLKADVLQLKAKNNMLLGNIVEANRVFKQQQYLIDSLEQVKINSNYTHETIKQEVDNKTNQLIESKKEIERKEKIAFYQKIGIVVLLLSVIGLFIVFKKDREKSKIIQDQKIVVDKSLNQKEILLKELHHRVKNNLQLISGLLNLQLQKHQHLDIREMMNESQNYIHSMALAHEMLYQDDNLAFIPMQNYIKELGKSSLKVLGDEKITFKTEIEAISLPINYATTLGLIFNELLTNSLKHAFQKNEGVISVSFSEESKNLYKFTYQDNGVGMSLSNKTTNSLGLKLIKMLAEEMDASMQVESNKGVFYSFVFKKKLNLDG